MIIETDFSADYEFRPRNAECCAFYKNASVLPFIIHYTTADGERRKDAIVVCSDDLGKNFKVHKHCLVLVLDKYLAKLGHVKKVSIATDNCRKQYRNRNLYGWVSSYCHEKKVSMGHLYQEQYHGKGLCDAICGIFKLLAKKETWSKDSPLDKKPIMDTHVKLAAFGTRKYAKNDSPANGDTTDDSRIDCYEFWTLEKDVAEDYPGVCVRLKSVCIYEHVNRSHIRIPSILPCCVLELADYASVVKHDLSQHEVYSDTSYERGDLRTREAFCACDKCLLDERYECLLPTETGRILKFYCKLSGEKEQKEEADKLEAVAEDFCKVATASTPLLMPLKIPNATDHPNQYEIGFPVRAVQTRPPTPDGAQQASARPCDWKEHMYWAYDRAEQRWRAALQAEWYGRAVDNTTQLDFVQLNKKRSPVWCDQVVPVDVSQHEMLAPASGKLQVPSALDITARRLNFMRFGIETQHL